MIQLLKNDKKTIIGTLNPSSTIVKRQLNGFNYFEMEHDLKGLGTVLKTEQYINAPTPKGMQKFKILKIDTLNENKLRVTAMHRMYDLTNNYVRDTNIVGKTRVQAIQQILDNTVNPHTFTVTGENTPTDNLRIVGYTPFYAIMGNKDNSVINRFAGELDFDNDKIISKDEIGQDNGYLLMYNKNMIELNESEDFTGVITKMIPRSRDGIFLDEMYVESTFVNAYEEIYIKEVEFDIYVSEDEENPKTEAQVKTELKKLAREYYLETKCDIPKISYTIPMSDVRNNPKYKDIKFMYKLDIGDYITVKKNSGLKLKIRLKEYSYDSIKEEFIQVVLNNTEDKYSLTTQDIIANVSNKLHLEVESIRANSIDVKDLTAINATIENINAKVAKIDSLLAGNITGENIQAGGITSDKLTIQNGFITNLMVKSVDVEKINAGTVSTNKFIIKSDDGGIEIVGATQQFKDKNNKVRIQMGQDAKGDFNFIIRGEDGTTTLIDHTGIKPGAIADDLIKEEMIAGDAVGEKQIDYSSFASGFNKDTNTTTLKSTKIRLDNQNQTLDIAFNQLKSQADGTKSLTESNSTTIGIQQGQINTAINNTQITKDGQTILLKDDYNRTVSTVNSTVETIGNHTSLIDANTGKITKVTTDVTQVKKDLTGITQRVGTTETNISTVTTTANNALTNANKGIADALLASNKAGQSLIDAKNYTNTQITTVNNTVSNAQSEINQLKNKIELKVEASDISTAVSNITIGGRNLLFNTEYTKNLSIIYPNCTTVPWGSRGQYVTSIDISKKHMNRNSLKVDAKVIGTSNGVNDVIVWTNIIDKLKVGSILVYKMWVYSTNGSKITFRIGGGVTSTGHIARELKPNVWNEVEVYFEIQSKREGEVALIFWADKIDTLWINSAILTLGNKAIDWTPAPEDTDKAIADTITITEEKIKTAKAEIKIETDKINLEVNKTNSVVTSHTTSINAVDGKINTAKNSAINTASGDATTKSNNALNTSKTYTETKVSEAKASIKIETDSIKQSVSSVDSKVTTVTTTANNALNSINNLELGSKNILTNTKDMIGNANLIAEKYMGLAVVSGTAGTTGYRDIYNVITPVLDGLEYTASFYAKSVNTSQTIVCHFYNPNNTIGAKSSTGQKSDNTDGRIEVSITNEWKRYWVQWKQSKAGSTQSIIIGRVSSSGNASISGMKLEKGNKTTDWTPAPEDVQGQIDTHTTQISTTNSKVATIETNLNGVTTRVTNAENTIKTVDGKVVAVDNRLKTAEQKITDSAIISTVSSTINNTVNNALNSYSTTSQMNSAINQSANGIKQEVSNTYITTGNANNIFATKASMELTNNQLRLDFTSSGGMNLIRNGGFETGNLKYWSHNGVNVTGVTTHNKYEGNYCALINSVNQGDGKGIFSEAINLVAGRVYSYSFMAYVERSNMTIGVEGVHMSTVTPGGYRRVTASFVPTTTGGKHFVIYTAGNSACYIDNIIVSEGNIPPAWSPHPDEIYNGNTIIDAGGVTINNGALKVKNNDGTEVIKADSAGNIMLTGYITGIDQQIKLIGDDCKLDGRNGRIRMQHNPYNYCSVGNGDFALYNSQQYNYGVYALTFSNVENGHYKIGGTGTSIKLLRSSAELQVRNESDGAYGRCSASDFNQASKREFKSNIHIPNEIDFMDILKSNDIKAYNYKSEVQHCRGKSIKKDRYSDYEDLVADVKTGFILEELTEDGLKYLHPTGTDGISLYSMSSILWKVCQEQQITIENLTKKVEQLQLA